MTVCRYLGNARESRVSRKSKAERRGDATPVRVEVSTNRYHRSCRSMVSLRHASLILSKDCQAGVPKGYHPFLSESPTYELRSSIAVSVSDRSGLVRTFSKTPPFFSIVRIEPTLSSSHVTSTRPMPSSSCAILRADEV